VGEFFKLRQQVEEAHLKGRDLLKELADRVDREIAQARDQLRAATYEPTP
jgi:hypothetical protein